MFIGLISYVVYDKVLDSKKEVSLETSKKNNETNKDDNVSESDKEESSETDEKNNETKKESDVVKKLSKEELLVKNEVDELIKLLDIDYYSSEDRSYSSYCFVEDFALYDQLDLLEYYGPVLMSCKFGLKYVRKDDLHPIFTINLMDEDMYNEFKNYFSTSLNEKYIIDGKTYYVAYAESDGYAVRQFDFQLNEQGITENNGVYTAIFDIFGNEFCNEDCYMGEAELKVSIKDNHIYYESFKITNFEEP